MLIKTTYSNYKNLYHIKSRQVWHNYFTRIPNDTEMPYTFNRKNPKSFKSKQFPFTSSCSKEIQAFIMQSIMVSSAARSSTQLCSQRSSPSAAIRVHHARNRLSTHFYNYRYTSTLVGSRAADSILIISTGQRRPR